MPKKKLYSKKQIKREINRRNKIDLFFGIPKNKQSIKNILNVELEEVKNEGFELSEHNKKYGNHILKAYTKKR